MRKGFNFLKIRSEAKQLEMEEKIDSFKQAKNANLMSRFKLHFFETFH